MAVNTSPFFFFLYGFTGCTKGFTCTVTPVDWGGSDPLPGTEGTTGTGSVHRLPASDGHFRGHSHHFSGILALPGSRPLGAHCHGNRVGMAACTGLVHWLQLSLPNRPRIVGVKQAGG